MLQPSARPGLPVECLEFRPVELVASRQLEYKTFFNVSIKTEIKSVKAGTVDQRCAVTQQQNLRGGVANNRQIHRLREFLYALMFSGNGNLVWQALQHFTIGSRV